MSTDVNQYAYFSVMADAILSAILIFLWQMQRKERHALYWGVGQLSIMAATALWFLPDSLLGAFKGPLCAIFIAGGVAGYWAGTRYFVGQSSGRWFWQAIAGLALALDLVWLFAERRYCLPVSGLVLGVMLVWAGVKLARGQHGYRLLGVTMCLRGLFTLAGIVALRPEAYQYWFMTGTLLKALSVLGLIYAVQHEIQQRYARTIDSLSNGFLIRDKRGFVHVANERCAQLLGYASAADLVGRNVTELLPGLTRKMADDYFAAFSAPGVQYPISQEAVFVLHNGKRLPVEMIGSPYLERGRLYCLVQLLDISERRKKDNLLYRAARVDPITGYSNRHALEAQLAQMVRAAESAGRECAVLFIDLDKFKRVNDSFGHVVGDELLCKVAARLHGQLAAGDLLARFGGDEFIVAMPDLPAGYAPEAARRCADTIIAALAQPFEVRHHGVGVSASIGVACYPQHGEDAAQLIRHADIAMYEAKRAGRGELRLFNEHMNAAAKEALVIDGALRMAVERGEFHLVYQPIMDARTRGLRKVEALLRWNSPLLGEVAPDRFIPVAEDSGLIVGIGRWVLQEACRQLAQWTRGAPDEIAVSINVSAWQLADPGFPALVAEALACNGLRPRQLELELTERVLIDDGEHVRGVLDQLRALGVGISLDDFGTGYSSLSYLTQFHLNTLKIDRAFVMDIERSERSSSLVHAIIAMGQSLGLQLVAEGVETAGQAQILEQMGCHYLQGYHLARPMPASELLLLDGIHPGRAAGAHILA